MRPLARLIESCLLPQVRICAFDRLVHASMGGPQPSSPCGFAAIRLFLLERVWKSRPSRRNFAGVSGNLLFTTTGDDILYHRTYNAHGQRLHRQASIPNSRHCSSKTVLPIQPADALAQAAFTPALPPGARLLLIDVDQANAQEHVQLSRLRRQPDVARADRIADRRELAIPHLEPNHRHPSVGGEATKAR